MVNAEAKRSLMIAFNSVMCVLFGVGNNVSFFEMARRMPVYSMFLLYATSAMYTSLYCIWAMYNVYTDPKRTLPFRKAFFNPRNQVTYFKLSACIFINGLLSQLSDTHVNGNIQGCLYQLAFPATGILAWWMLKNHFSIINIIGSVLVIGGCLMVAVPPFFVASSGVTTVPHCYGEAEGTVGGWKVVWIIAFAVSVIPNGVTAVLQEQLFHRQPNLDIVLILFWSNISATAGYVLSIPLRMLPGLGHFTWEELWLNQYNAFRCFAGQPVCGCIDGALFPVLAFVVCYMGFFYFLAKLVKEVSAVFEALINAVVTPASSIAFSFTWLLSTNAEPLTPWVIAGSIVVPLGVLVFKAKEIKVFMVHQSAELHVHHPKPSIQHDNDPLLQPNDETNSDY